MSSSEAKPWRRCGPFPDYTSLEAALLHAVIAAEPDDTLARQRSACQVVDRDNTWAGFYTRIAVDAAAAPASPRHLSDHDGWVQGPGGHMLVPGLKNGLGFILWFKRGYLDCIEGFTYGFEDETPEELSELELLEVTLG